MGAFVRVAISLQCCVFVAFGATPCRGQTPIEIRFELSKPGEIDIHYFDWESPEGLQIGEIFYGQRLKIKGNGPGNYSDVIRGKPDTETGLVVLVKQDIYTEERISPDCPDVTKEVFEETQNFELRPLSSKPNERFGGLALRSRGLYRPLAGAGSFLLPETCSRLEVHYDRAVVGTKVRIVGYDRRSRQSSQDTTILLKEPQGKCELAANNEEGIRGFN